MNDLEINIIKQLNSLNGVTLDPSRKTFVFPTSGNELTIKEIISSGIDIEDAGNVNKEIDLIQLPFNTFFDENDFLKRVTRYSWSKSIFIYNLNIYYSIESEKTFKENISTDNYFLVLNNHYCFKFFDFLKTQEHQENSAFYFVDYLNWDTFHLVLTSLKKDGKIDIPLPKLGVNINKDIKLPSAVSDFIGAFSESNKHFPKFIKIELIANLVKVEKSKRLEILLFNLNEIVFVASQNFEIYLHDLSLENLKKDFVEQKNKYFIQLRDILSKLTNQIIGLPLAIGISVFSTYKITDSIPTLLLVLFVFYLYASFTIFLLKLQKEDIQDIKLSFNSDFRMIRESEYFLKFPTELIAFEKVKRNLDLRIGSLIKALDFYFIFSSVSNIAFTIYVENQLKISNSGMIVTSVLLTVCFSIVYALTQTLRKDL